MNQDYHQQVGYQLWRVTNVKERTNMQRLLQNCTFMLTNPRDSKT